MGAVDRWSDFVFNDYGKEGFENESLQEVKQYIDTYGHLPEQTSAKEVEQNGYLLGDMDAKLLERIERLYLHAIAQDKKIKALKEQLNQ